MAPPRPPAEHTMSCTSRRLFALLGALAITGCAPEAGFDTASSLETDTGLGAEDPLLDPESETPLPLSGEPDLRRAVPYGDDLLREPNGLLYATEGKWSHRTLTWCIDGWTADLGVTPQVEAIQAAARTWAEGSGLWLAYVAVCTAGGVPFADIVVSFEDGDHGDGDPFDGSGGVLAHAAYPEEGFVHFDDDELWGTEDDGTTYDLQTVALHELGHALGLEHSTDRTAVMYAYYPGERRALAADDVAGIESLYGATNVYCKTLDTYTDYAEYYAAIASDYADAALTARRTTYTLRAAEYARYAESTLESAQNYSGLARTDEPFYAGSSYALGKLTTARSQLSTAKTAASSACTGSGASCTAATYLGYAYSMAGSASSMATLCAAYSGT